MKCLTICEPYASAIIHGPKRIENRSWPTPYRGPLLIHAGKSTSYLGTLSVEQTQAWGPAMDRAQPYRLGYIIGRVELADCRRIEDLPPEPPAFPWAVGPWCWILRNPQAFALPVPCKGVLGLFEIDLAALAATAPIPTPPTQPSARSPYLWD